MKFENNSIFPKKNSTLIVLRGFFFMDLVSLQDLKNTITVAEQQKNKFWQPHAYREYYNNSNLTTDGSLFRK